MKTQVITIASREPNPVTEPYYHLREFKESAKRHGIVPHFLEEGPWGGLGCKPRYLLKYLQREGSNFDLVCVVDSFDIIFLTGLDELVRKFCLFDMPVIFNAERNCFPRADLAEQHEPCVTPFRFLNSGFYFGTTEGVMEMLTDMKAQDIPNDHVDSTGKKIEPNDQTLFMEQYLANRGRIGLDTAAILAQSLHGSEPDEFTWDSKTQRVTSRITGNQPCVLHGNGSGKTWLKRVIHLSGL